MNKTIYAKILDADDATALIMAEKEAQVGDATSRVLYALTLATTSKKKEALSVLTEINEKLIDPKSIFLVDEIKLLQLKGKFSEAVFDASKEISYRHEAAGLAKLVYADNLAHRGDLEGAIKLLEQILGLYPEAKNLWISLANLHLRRKDHASGLNAIHHMNRPMVYGIYRALGITFLPLFPLYLFVTMLVLNGLSYAFFPESLLFTLASLFVFAIGYFYKDPYIKRFGLLLTFICGFTFAHVWVVVNILGR